MSAASNLATVLTASFGPAFSLRGHNSLAAELRVTTGHGADEVQWYAGIEPLGAKLARLPWRTFTASIKPGEVTGLPLLDLAKFVEALFDDLRDQIAEYVITDTEAGLFGAATSCIGSYAGLYRVNWSWTSTVFANGGVVRPLSGEMLETAISYTHGPQEPTLVLSPVWDLASIRRGLAGRSLVFAAHAPVDECLLLNLSDIDICVPATALPDGVTEDPTGRIPVEFLPQEDGSIEVRVVLALRVSTPNAHVRIHDIVPPAGPLDELDAGRLVRLDTEMREARRLVGARVGERLLDALRRGLAAPALAACRAVVGAKDGEDMVDSIRRAPDDRDLQRWMLENGLSYESPAQAEEVRTLLGAAPDDGLVPAIERALSEADRKAREECAAACEARASEIRESHEAAEELLDLAANLRASGNKATSPAPVKARTHFNWTGPVGVKPWLEKEAPAVMGELSAVLSHREAGQGSLQFFSMAEHEGGLCGDTLSADSIAFLKAHLGANFTIYFDW